MRFKIVGCVGLGAFFLADLAEFSWRFSGRIWFGSAVAVRAIGDRADRLVCKQGHDLVVGGDGSVRSKAC